MIKRFKIAVLCLGLVAQATHGYGAFNVEQILGKVPGAEQAVGLLVTDIEFREKQLATLEKEKAELAKKADDEVKRLASSLRSIEEEIGSTKTAAERASGSYEEFLKKKLELLTDRKQTRGNFRDARKEVVGKVEKHRKLVGTILEYLKGRVEKKEERSFYSWKDLDDAKNKIDKLSGELDSQEFKRDRLKRSRAAEKDEIALLKKEIDTKKTEKESLVEEYKKVAATEEVLAQELSAKIEVADQVIRRAQEKIEFAQFKMQDLGRDERYKDDEIFLLNQKLVMNQSMLGTIQKRLRIEASDVSLVKEELEKERKVASFKKSDLARKRSVLKGRRDTFDKTMKLLEEQVAKIKSEGKEKTALGYLVKSRLIAARSERNAVERQLDLYSTGDDSADILVQIKELRARVIEVLYEVGLSKEKIDEWLTSFKTKRRSADHAERILRAKRDEIDDFIASINKEREELETKIKEVEEQGPTIFSGRQRDYYETITNLKNRAKTALRNQKVIIEKHFSQLSELSSRQEELMNQYKFIVSFLRSQRTLGIWKRSSHAISPAQLTQSFLEFEDFFARLFWDTPAYLGPVGVFYGFQSWDLSDLLGLLIFFILFFTLLFGLRVFATVFHKNIRHWLRRLSGRFSEGFVLGAERLTQFFLDHFTLIFSWLFFYLHFAFGLEYCKLLTSPYASALFFILSIFILLSLARRFVSHLRAVNIELNYSLISEALQRKVTLLVELFLYATAVLLPLRRALLSYATREIVFDDVALAAYTLIVIVIILFFFNKEDILKVLSSRNPFVVFLHKQVDRYYYPVFGFLMFLLILSNPYIGYSTLAWYLAFAVPATLLLLYGLFLIHSFIRKYSLFFFIKEEDDEVMNKFDHAKAYYGLFVAVSFIALALGALVFLARIWGFEGFTPAALWKALSEEWVLNKDTKNPLGFIQLIQFGAFITAGLLISSLIKKFVLGKVFEIFRTEPGVQMTVSKILHYTIIFLTIIFGFASVGMQYYALTAAGTLLIGVGFGIKDQIADYFAGVLVLLERPLEIGHYVETGEYQGKVHRISARSTTIKTARNFFIIVPNRDLISKPIINWGQGRYAVGCELKVMVSFDSDLELVRTTLKEVIQEHSMVLRVPAPVVRFEGFESSALFFYCRCYVSARKVLDMWDLQSDLRFAIIKTFQEKGITIPYQQTVVHLAKGSKPAGAKPGEKGEGEKQGGPGGVPTGGIDIKFDRGPK